MPDQAAIVQELYNRMGSLPPDKQAIVTELARRFGVGAADPNYVPDALGRSFAANHASANAAIENSDDVQMPGHPYGGAPLVTSNPRQLAQAHPALGWSPMVQSPLGGAGMVDGAAQLANAHSGLDVARGAHQVIGGTLGVLSPTLAPAAIAAPVATGLTLAGGMLAQKGTTAGLQAAGAPQEYADLAGDLAGLAGGWAAGHYGPQVPGAVARGVQSGASRMVAPQLDPTEAASVAYGRDAGVKMPLSVQTGSKVVANAENILQNLPFAGGVAKTARAAEQSSLAEAGSKEVAGLAPGATGPVPQPLDVGEALQRTALANEQQHNAAANDAYDLFRSIEAQPQFTANLQTGTKLVDSGMLDEAGNPTTKRVPVMEDVQLPVDYRGFKQAIAPLLADTLRPMSIAQEQASTGIKALRNIVAAPDFVPASVADQDLGALKGIMRDSAQSRSVALAKIAADMLSKQVDQAAERAGPDAVAALKQGRASTVAKYDAQDFQRAIGFKDVGTSNVTPGSAVDLVSKLTRDGDRSIDLLRQVEQNSPEHIPALAQSVVQGLLDQATAEAGQAKPKTALTAYNKLGDQTKQILFGDNAERLGNFFTLAKRIADNPNPSGSGQLMATLKAAGMVLTQPHIGIPALIGSKALARMLFNPESSRLIMSAMKMPANSGAAGAAIAGKLAAAAAQAAGTDNPSGPMAATAAPVATSDNGPTPGAPPSPTPGPTAGPRGGLAGAVAAPAAEGRSSNALRSSSTNVSVPGQPGPGYLATYKLRELDDLQPSHSGLTFEANPKYGISNDRDYQNAVNQGKIVNWASRAAFDPKQLLTDLTDSTAGPPVTDTAGNVLGGNGRAMIMQRVNAGNPSGAAAYRQMLMEKAPQFGIDPAAVAAMKKPVLTREIPDSEFTGGRTKQTAVTDFNKTGTAALTPGEQMVSDSRRVSPDTLSDIAGRLDAHGEGATLAEVLKGKAGGEVLQKLIGDGVLSQHQAAAFVTPQGELTPAGRDRISGLMIGRFFADPNHLDTIAPSIRNKMERVSAPLAQVESKPDWNLTPHVQQALALLEGAQKLGVKNLDDFVDQDGLFGRQRYSPQAVAIAKALQGTGSRTLTPALRRYAEDAAFAAGGNSLFGATPTPESSFAEAFPQPKNALGAEQPGAAARTTSSNALGRPNAQNSRAGRVATAAPPAISPEMAQSILDDEHELPEGWYLHGRARSSELSNDWPIQMTRDIHVANGYAASKGSVWAIRPNESTKVADFSDSDTPHMDAFVRSLKRQFAAKSPETEAVRASLAERDGVEPGEVNFSDFENYVRNEFTPADIVSSAQAYDNNHDLELLKHYPGGFPHMVKTPDGAVVMPGASGHVDRVNLTALASLKK